MIDKDDRDARKLVPELERQRQADLSSRPVSLQQSSWTARDIKGNPVWKKTSKTFTRICINFFRCKDCQDR